MIGISTLISAGEFADALGGRDALGDAVHGVEDLVELSSLADALADGAVAAFGADAGGDQIAQSRQAEEASA